MDSRSLPALDSLRCFLVAAERLSFRAAADGVGLTPAALGQRIRQLEEQLGARLFDRTTRRVALTEAGMSLVPHAENALAAAARCGQAVRGDLDAAPMSITIGTRHELGMSWLMPMLPRLGEARANLTLHIYVGSGSDLASRVRHQHIDCAVTSSAPADPVLGQLLLHPEEYALLAAPGRLRRHPFAKPGDAGSHALIDIDESLPLYRYWRDSPKTYALRFAGARYMGTIATIRKLVLAGVGVAVLPEYFAGPDLDRGRLVKLFPEHALLSDHFRLIFRDSDRRRPLFDRLAAIMRQVELT